MLKQSATQAQRRAQFRALGQRISQFSDRDYRTGKPISGEWMARVSQMPDKDRTKFGPQLRVMQFETGNSGD